MTHILEPFIFIPLLIAGLGWALWLMVVNIIIGSFVWWCTQDCQPKTRKIAVICASAGLWLLGVYKALSLVGVI